MKLCLIGCILVFSPLSGAAYAQPADPQITPVSGPNQLDQNGEAELPRSGASVLDSSMSICGAIETVAAQNGLPFEFFARVIWQESRFKSDAVGPVTRNGQRAQGIAQFMPMTAAERLLQNPFDPSEALPKSAEFLRELRSQFGNLGLAAAAYNAGPQRVRDWIAAKRSLPTETQNYVRSVTGLAVHEWLRPDITQLSLPVPSGISCLEMVKLRPKPSVFPSASQTRSSSAWVVQLYGDRSEMRALALFRELKKNHEALLKGYEPEVVRTTLKGGTAPIWARVRVDLSSREAALGMCASLRAAGADCLVQRNWSQP
jgi:Transglycosylase SLT domain/SPOR domain